MYVVTVTFKIHPGQMDQFLPLMVENARTSRNDETGCQLFDVCRDGDEVFLYEVYDDRAAFDLHLESAHFKAFSAKVDTLVAGKELRLYQEVIR